MPVLGKSKESRTFAAARFILELDGQNVGVLHSVDGGHFKSEAIGEQVGSEGLVTRFPGRQKFDDFTIQLGASMTPGFWKWVKASIDNKYQRRNGAVISCDFDGRERGRRTFSNALISEIQFPAPDAKSKNPAMITVKISPEYMQYVRADAAVKTRSNLQVTKQKMWVPQNFQFNLDAIPKEVTRHIVKLDAITVKQNIIVNPIGNELWPRKEVGRIEFPTLSVYVPETYSKSWYQWWDKFVAKGEHIPANESSGSLVYLASDCTTQLMTLTFKNIGITGITFDKFEAAGEPIRCIKVDLYTESMEFSTGSGTAVAAS